MGRLIDADKLLETLQDLEPHCENKDYEYGMLNTIRYYRKKIIKDEPTAYDVDKVVEQMKESSRKMVTSKFPHKYYRAIGTRKCEQIVRAGGKE